jgi:hypothetical protein
VPDRPLEITKPNILVVEGKDEEGLFTALIKHLDLEASIQVLPIGGKTTLRPYMQALRSTTGFLEIVKSIGIMRDADEDADAAFQSICDTLRVIGLPVPDRLLAPTATRPSVAIMILPGEGRPGMLENVVLDAVQDEPVMTCIPFYFNCLADAKIDFPRNMAKARLQVFLAAKEPGKRLGEAAKDGHWSYSHPAFTPLGDFIRSVAE